MITCSIFTLVLLKRRSFLTAKRIRFCRIQGLYLHARRKCGSTKIFRVLTWSSVRLCVLRDKLSRCFRLLGFAEKESAAREQREVGVARYAPTAVLNSAFCRGTHIPFWELFCMKPAARNCLFAAISLLPSVIFAQPSAPRPVTIDDYFQFREVHDPQLSPDAKWLAYAVTSALLKDDTSKQRIWMVQISDAGTPLADPIDASYIDVAT